MSHGDVAHKSDAELQNEATAHLGRHAGLQLCAELLGKLRELGLPWWTPDQLRQAYPAAARLAWFESRPDLRQRITTSLTGLAPKAARNKSPAFQAELIDSVIDDGDIAVDDFEAAFDPVEIALYAPAADVWRLFRRRMPWDDDATAHQDLIGWLVGALLRDKSTLDGISRVPILTAWQVRTAIDGRVWNTRIPLDVRVAIDEARLRQQRERPSEPFHAAQDLQLAPPVLIAASLPLKELVPVFDVAGRALGFESVDDARPNGISPATRMSVAPPAGDVAADGVSDDTPSSSDHPPVDGAPEAAPATDPPGPDAERMAEDDLSRTNPWATADVQALMPKPSGDPEPPKGG